MTKIRYYRYFFSEYKRILAWDKHYVERTLKDGTVIKKKAYQLEVELSRHIEGYELSLPDAVQVELRARRRALRDTTADPVEAQAMVRELEYIAFLIAGIDYTTRGESIPGQEEYADFVEDETETKAELSQEGRKDRRTELTQKKAAEKCGRTIRTIQKWEKGEGTPKGYPGRGSATAFYIWLEEWRTVTSMKRAQRRMKSIDRAVPASSLGSGEDGWNIENIQNDIFGGD